MPPFEACFYVIISGNFERILYMYTYTLKQIFLKTKKFFKKLEFRFLVESTKIENVAFPYKTALLEAKSMDWFLYDKDLSHKRVNKLCK